MDAVLPSLPGPQDEPWVIAEIAQAHDGSLGTAHAMIDAAADAGARAVKFQTHLADAESSLEEPWRVKFSPQDATRMDYWRRMEFTPQQWAGLAEHAAARGLLFLSSAFSLEAVDLLHSLNMAWWKVASGEIHNTLLLRAMLRTGRPLLLSSGMSSWAELDRAVGLVREAGNPLAVFQCTSSYPCPAEATGLNVLQEMFQRYGCPVGLSDHSGEIFAGLAAVALGASLIEVHLTLSRKSFGPDVSSSLEPDDLARLVRGVHAIHVMRTHPLNKDAAAEKRRDLREIFGQSLCARKDLPAGHILREENLSGRKPGSGIPVADWEKHVGKRLTRAVRRGEFLRLEHLEISS